MQFKYIQESQSWFIKFLEYEPDQIIIQVNKLSQTVILRFIGKQRKIAQNINIYPVQTNFGFMDLVIQQIFDPNKESLISKRRQIFNKEKRYYVQQKKNKLQEDLEYHFQNKCCFNFFPLIYQQIQIKKYQQIKTLVINQQKQQQNSVYSLIISIRQSTQKFNSYPPPAPQFLISQILEGYYLLSKRGLFISPQKLYNQAGLIWCQNSELYKKVQLYKQIKNQNQNSKKINQSKRLSFEFFILEQIKSQQESNIIKRLIKVIKSYAKKQYPKNKVYLIDDKIFLWKIRQRDFQEIYNNKAPKTWLQFCILMNIPFTQQIQVTYNLINKINKQLKLPKKTLLKQIQGFQNINFLHPTDLENSYQILNQFLSGRCLQLFQSINFANLQSQQPPFFSPCSVYRIGKEGLIITVSRHENNINKNASFIIIQSNVTKLQCVQFFIIYMKYFGLQVLKIAVLSDSYRIQISLQQQKVGSARHLYIQFPVGFSIKQDQLAVILNRADLMVGCELILANSLMSDKLLILSSNSQKTSKFHKLDFSQCKNFTDSTLGNFFDSSYVSSSLLQIDISGTNTNQSTLDAIQKNLNQLRVLKMNNCKYIDIQTTLRLSSCSLKVFQAVQSPNINIDLQDPCWRGLQILKITSIEMYLDNLKYLAKIPLQQLTIKLIQNNKKQKLLNYISNYITTQPAAIKQFLDGLPGKTLKKLDLSYSSLKIKNLKSLIQIRQLVSLKLNYCYPTILSQQQVNSFDPLPKDLQILQWANSYLSQKLIKILIQKIGFLKLLNISSKTLSPRATLQVFQVMNRSINELVIFQTQFSYNLINYVNRLNNPSKSITSNCSILSRIQILLIDEDSKQSKDDIKSMSERRLAMLYQSIYINKMINFICKDKQQEFHIASRIGHFANSKLIRINQRTVQQILQRNQQVAKSTENKLDLYQYKDITLFTHKLLKYILKQSLISKSSCPLLYLNIRNNKYLKADCIKMISKYSLINNNPPPIKQIDFRNCLFSFQEVAQDLFLWNNLEQVNQGQFQLQWKAKNFHSQAQKHLKFFMKVVVRQFKVYIHKVKEVQLVFSLLYYIISHQKLSLNGFEVIFNKIQLQDMPEAQQLWEALFNTITLTKITIRFHKCFGLEPHNNSNNKLSPLKKHLPQLNHLKLHYLQLRLPKQPLFSLQIISLQQLILDLRQYFTFYQGQRIVVDQGLSEVLKNYTSNTSQLKTLDLNCSRCISLTSIDRTLGILKQIKGLQNLIFSVQYTPIKYPIPALLQSLKQLKKLRNVILNASFTLPSINISEDISVTLLSLADSLGDPQFQLIGLGVLKHSNVQYYQQLGGRNIKVIY